MTTALWVKQAVNSLRDILLPHDLLARSGVISLLEVMSEICYNAPAFQNLWRPPLNSGSATTHGYPLGENRRGVVWQVGVCEGKLYIRTGQHLLFSLQRPPT
jgi:hypothetical protein